MKKVFISFIAFFILFLAGFILHLHQYPKEEFNKFYTKIVADAGNNQWLHKRQLADHTFRDFVKPIYELLYSYCMVDLSNGPVMIKAPPSDRYWVIQFMQENTNVIGYMGSRTNGLNRGAKAVLVPQGYAGDTKGLDVISSPTRYVWIMARMVVNNEADIPRVTRLQDQLKCIPL